MWLIHFLIELGYSPWESIYGYCDDKAACEIAHNPIHHEWMELVHTEKFFIKEKLYNKIVELPKVQLVDILTIVVLSKVFLKFIGKLGMNVIYATTWGEVFEISHIE